MKIILTTNGALLQQKEVQLLKELDIMFIRVSLDGASADTHDQFRDVPGTFERATHAIRELVDAGINTTILTTVSRFNLNEISKIADLAAQLGAKTFSHTMLIPLGRGKRVKHLMPNAGK